MGRGSPEDAEEQYLVELEPLPSGYPPYTGSADLGGRTFAQTVSFSVDKSSFPSSYAEYNLGRRWKYFDATIGVRDDSPSGGRITFQALVDGRSAYRRELGVGETAKVKVNVSGALRLTLNVSFTAGEYYDNYSYGSWGDARLSG
ncbi:NPCBM/NEW2 domain-containing protein [Streptomyces gardneri]|uniref:NPCBM/NEW2 domain-containing protein n=1 Tax=Streptomyces gardneri TaxID=66892 RepID=UPI0036881A32